MASFTASPGGASWPSTRLLGPSAMSRWATCRATAVETGASVVEPCSFKGQPANDKLPDQGRCEVVAIDYGDMKVKVAVDPLDNRGDPVPEADRKRRAPS